MYLVIMPMGMNYSDTTNIATLRTSTGPSSSTGDDTYFKIAAKASISQVSGEYNNVINFLVVASPNPVSFYDAFTEAASLPGSTITTLNGYYKMQDMTADICNAIEQEESQMSLIDIRDHNIYTVAKLKDNRCWMTTNLNLEGGTQLSHEDTDIPEGYTLPIANGFQEGNRLPESSTQGFNSASVSRLYNSHNTDCGEDRPCYSYYSWTTATVGSGLTIASKNTDAPYSVCPKNWVLPSSRNSNSFDDTIATKSTFYKLAVSYGMTEGAWYQSAPNFYRNAGPDTVPNLIAAGDYAGSNYYNGDVSGFYWSSTSLSSNNSLSFHLSRTGVGTAEEYGRWYGFSIRCIANYL